MLGFSTSKPDAQTVPTVRPLDAEVLWEAIQSWRQSEGLPKYQKDEGLCRIATNRVSDGIDNHKGLYEKYGDYSSVIQENSNDGYHSEKDSLNGWLNSQAHHETLKKRYLYSCVATSGDFAVQIFSNCENGCP